MKQITEEDPENPGCFVHLISFITAYARARLSKFEFIAGFDSFFYADTDSLVVSEAGYRRLEEKKMMDNIKLGKLKVEHRMNMFHALSPKCYVFHDIDTHKTEAKSKGVNLDHLQGNVDEIL